MSRQTGTDNGCGARAAQLTGELRNPRTSEAARAAGVADVSATVSAVAPAFVRVPLQREFASLFPELSIPGVSIRPESPEILALNEPLARELGLDPAWLASGAGVRFLLGNELPVDSTPVSQAYAGHQWGIYQPRLGDGRALLLGELANHQGVLRDLHLKGSGTTPFSRGGDGRAAVGPMLREYLMGEAMHALNIPATRALAVIVTGETVLRDGGLTELPGAVLVRTASSHMRIGTFQLARASGDLQLLRRLADYAIERHFPECKDADKPYRSLLSAVVRAQAHLVASWMLVGFVHGVMSTDNTTISGETIDFGPCAFLDQYDLAAVFSSIDERGRYSFRNQPGITLWNLTRFAETLLPLLSDEVHLSTELTPTVDSEGIAGGETDNDADSPTEATKQLARDQLAEFGPHYDRVWIDGMRTKFGLSHVPPEQLSDEKMLEIASAALGELHAGGGDFTRFFRALANSLRSMPRELTSLLGIASLAEAGRWHITWSALSPDLDAMDRVNPVIIPRNHLVDLALASAEHGDLEPFEKLLAAVSHPFTQAAGWETYGYPAPPELGPHVTYCGT